jgi:hypothetical protein
MEYVTGKFPRTLPGIEPGTSYLVAPQPTTPLLARCRIFANAPKMEIIVV